MGSSASKASRAAAARKYPSRPSPSTQSPFSAPPPSEPSSRPSPQASSTRSEAINLDATDPVYASNLRQIGVVQPNPFFTPQHPSDPHSITPPGLSHDARRLPSYVQPAPPNLAQFFPDPHLNPALRILQARQQLQDEAERELEMLGRRGFEGRRFLRSGEIRHVLALREAGVGDEEIEKRMGLRKGVVRVLAPRKIVENVV